MALKESIENHPVVVFGTALILGFGAGVATVDFLAKNGGEEGLADSERKVLNDEISQLKDRLLLTDTDRARNIPVAIDAQKGWQHSGVILKPGEMVSIKVVSGRWSAWHDMQTGTFHWPETAGVGVGRLCGEAEFRSDSSGGCPIKTFNAGSLIAQIGGLRYGIGIDCVFPAVRPGAVELRINDPDWGLADNTGMLAVEVAKVSDRGFDSSKNCGFPID